MKTVLVLCEFSGAVSSAFREKGFISMSNDLLPSDLDDQHHIQGDCFAAIDIFKSKVGHIDLIVMFPPCTAIAVSGNRFYGRGMPKHEKRIESIEWTLRLWEYAKANADHVAMENPVNVLPVKATQFIHPYEFGHPEQKKTGLWLHNLPELTETCNVYATMMALPKKDRERIHYMSPSKDRWKLRSTTFSGIAKAMALQWGDYLNG